MPLPANSPAWPPPLLTDRIATMPPIQWQMQAWSAWYSGNRQELEQVYALNPQVREPLVRDRPAQYRGGIVGTVARFFWGQPRGDLTQTVKAKLHVPIAADLCAASAHLLFAEPPAFTVEDTRTQDRLNELVDDGLHGTVTEAAELAAALGSAYLRVCWDREIVPDRPFLDPVDADAAIPEFRYGRLHAVTFWRHLHTDSDTRRVWRHLERHELDGSGIGIILHGLYAGTPENLGRPMPLQEHPATEPFATLVDAEGAISTESPGLDVVYLPNRRPQRLWRKHPLGRSYGRSDLDGVEGHMDALDETYTSWMRDIRLGKARLVVGRSMIEDGGPGNGGLFNEDQEIYSPVNVLPSRDGSGLPMEQVQFAIRVAEHQQTAHQLIGDIVRLAGYSAQTFGESSDTAATATEVQARQQRSFLTRDDKIRLARPALAALVEKLLAVDKAVFGSPVAPQRPVVQFADGVQESQLSLAQTAQTLRNAQAASTEVIVRTVHPDWSDEQVQQEVQRISNENAVPDPASPALFG